jgi:glycosyltransferase involved in cell wall biosynthesis
MKIVLSHPGVAPFVQQAAAALHERGWLEAYHTSFAYRPAGLFGRMLRATYGILRRDADAQLRRRRVDAIPDERLQVHPLWEMLRVGAQRLAGDVVGDRVWERTEHAFDRAVAGTLRPGLDAVYGYEHSSLALFERARQLGLGICYDMPAPHHRMTSGILEAELAANPGLQTAHYRHTRGHTPRRNARRDAELRLADCVVCASALTEQSLLAAGVGPGRILRVPYGMPAPSPRGSESRSGPLKFLYAGTLSVRKGVQHVLRAWQALRPAAGAELCMVGANAMPPGVMAGLPPSIRVLRSVPREELFRLYHESDLLLFPTLLDGFGMVLTEALACGLPVLTTPRAGSSDFIVQGRNGFVTAPGDAAAIAATLEWCFANPGQLRAMRPACIEAARAWQWSDYRRTLADGIAQHLARR